MSEPNFSAIRVSGPKHSDQLVFAEAPCHVLVHNVAAWSSAKALFVLCADEPIALISSLVGAFQLRVQATKYTSVWRISLPTSLNDTTVYISSPSSKTVRRLEAPGGRLVRKAISNLEPPAPSLPFWERIFVASVLALVILGSLFLLSAFDPLQKRFAVLIAAAGALLPFVGLSFEARPVWALAARVRQALGPKIFRGAFAMLFVGLGTAVYTPLDCLWRAYRFELAIETAVSPVGLETRYVGARRALIIFPNRLEPYFVISKLVDEHRVSSRNQMKEFSQRLIDDAHITGAIVRFLASDPAAGCRCTRQTAADLRHAQRQVLGWTYFRLAEKIGDLRGHNKQPLSTGNPVLSFEFDKQLSDQTKQQDYYQLLKTLLTVDALSYAALYQVRAGADASILPEEIRVSFDLIEATPSKILSYLYSKKDSRFRTNLAGDFLVQAAYDKLVLHHLWSCELPKARAYLAELMLLRARTADSGTLWLIGPEKFISLTLIRTLRASKATLHSFLYLPAYDLNLRLRDCPDWQTESAKFKKLMTDDYPEWWKPDERRWFAGSIQGLTQSQLREILISSSHANWRY